MHLYLQSTEYINWQHPTVLTKAKVLATGTSDRTEIARRCFEFIRDGIRHSWDYRLNPVTCAASQVLEHGTGYCYAKSHLLAALLRANAIPAGLCYQRLSLEGNGASYCLHGLNAVWLPDYGWYRVDPRGNKPGIDARFCPPVEKLAFSTDDKLEADLPEIWPEPLPLVVKALTTYSTVEDVYRNLPDMQLLNS
jgi:transglutaminase-like putative cysteine protease